MTEERIKELLTASECKDSFDSGIVRELFVELDRLHGLLGELNGLKPNLETEIARLTQALQQLPNEAAAKEEQLRNELAEREKQCRNAKAKIDEQNDDFKSGLKLLNFCLDHLNRTETVDYIRKKLKNFMP